LSFLLFLLLFLLFFIPLLVMYTYSSLRYAPLYCLIHTPLSPLDKLSAPPEGDRPSSIPEGFRETFTVVGVLGVLVEKGEEETRDRPPLKPLFPHPWSTTSTGNSRHPISGLVIPRDVGESHPSENGTFFLCDRLRKVTARNQQICG
jgi:hypothetical protein